jgi:serine-type D-Ala-D-Ala carboxypeptidase (penicillin-binding protein 5/6)
MKKIYTDGRKTGKYSVSRSSNKSGYSGPSRKKSVRRRPSKPKVSYYGITSVTSRGYFKVLLTLLAFLIIFFAVSCMIVASSSNISSAVTQTERVIKVPAGSEAQPPALYAASAILTDRESGRVLYEKNAHQELPVASTTKIMTALIVRDRLSLSDKVTISPQAAQVGEQEVGFSAGEVVTAEDLLWSLIVLSANDAAEALAEQVAGSGQAFAELMNKKASQLGLKESHFMNPHGLDVPGHYSSSHDLAILARELLADPVLAKMAAATKHDIAGPPGQPPRTLWSHNEILTQYQGADGVKTGYTAGAGFCLVASATRAKKHLISVVLNSPHRATDVTAMFDYGFNATRRVVFAREGQALGRSRVSAFPRRYVKVVPQTEMAALSLNGSGDSFRVRVTFARKVNGVVTRGMTLGAVQCWMNRSPIEKGRVVAASRQETPGPITSTVAFLWYTLCWMGRIVSAPFRIF